MCESCKSIKQAIHAKHGVIYKWWLSHVEF